MKGCCSHFFNSQTMHYLSILFFIILHRLLQWQVLNIDIDWGKWDMFLQYDSVSVVSHR